MAQIPADIQTISVVITTVSIVFGIIVAVIQIRNLVKTRQIRLYLQLYHNLSEKEVLKMGIEILLLWKWKDLDDFFEKYGPEKNLDQFTKFTLVTTAFENIGLVLKEKLVNVRWVAYLIGSMVQTFWEKYEPVLIEMRKRFNTPKIMPMTEYLYERLKVVRPR